jgi:hypothetical protein
MKTEKKLPGTAQWKIGRDIKEDAMQRSGTSGSQMQSVEDSQDLTEYQRKTI